MSKTAIITGSAGGLGKGIAERLANDGFNIVLQDINEALLLETEKEFKEKGYQAVAFKSDVSKKKRTGRISSVRSYRIWSIRCHGE